jgi:hypothetical protein
VLVVLVLGCGPDAGTATPAATPGEDYVGRDAPADATSLRFRDPAEGRRFTRVRECFAARPAGAGWRHYPLRRIGNFVQEDWCTGDHSQGCAGGSFSGERGDEWYGVYTLHYDQDWPEVFGLGVSAGRQPRTGEWGVSFSYTANGDRIINSTFGVSFHRFEGEKIAQNVHIGYAYVYKVAETQIQVDAPGTQDEELARLIASPESFKATATGRIDALLVEVLRQIDAQLPTKCVYGPYAGDGIPPICTPTPLTAEERDAARATARAELGARRDAITRHAAEFHKMLGELMAFDRCW